MIFVKYGNQHVALDYRQKIFENLNGQEVRVLVEKEIASLEREDFELSYRTAEEEALAYLIRDAMERTERDKLLGICGIKQRVCLSPVNGHFMLEFALKGIAV